MQNKRHAFSIILVASLTAILIFLAVLQYRWSGQVSKAEQERMQASLVASMQQFRLQFNDGFREAGFLLRPEMEILAKADWDSYAKTCDAVLNSLDRQFVRDIYLLIVSDSDSTNLLHLNRKLKKFETIPWPAELEPVRAKYAKPSFDPLPPPRMRPFEWSLVHSVPLMIQPLIRFQQSPGPNGRFIGYLMLHLKLEMIYNEIFPELARKYFAGPDGFIYHVAVVQGTNPPEILYKSHPQLSLASFALADAKISLRDIPPDRAEVIAPEIGQPDPGPYPPGRPEPNRFQPAEIRPSDRQFFVRIRPPQSEDRLRGMRPPEQEGPTLDLIAKHREGSLESVVAGSRRRNLALSFGVLLLLAISMALVLVFARRAQRLAQLQIHFVAGVSHELRTPLAVICSAGDNLADGVVSDSNGSSRKYGELIREEARKLTRMIEQILQYAYLQAGGPKYNLKPSMINEITTEALNRLMPAIAADGFSVDINFDPDLPPALVDPAALSQAIQNLIQNAVKYSGENRWIGIRTEKGRSRSGIEIRVIIEDKGMGIDSDDLPHVFEPFYRGSEAQTAQIHGTGLGLFIVQKILQAMNGSASVKSSRSKGSAFMLRIPALPENGNPTEKEDTDAVQNTPY